MNEPIPTSRRRSHNVAIALVGVAYVVLLGWLATRPPAFDAASMHARIEQLAQRPAAPVDPLPVLRVTASAKLQMLRDPMR